jgi:hypothetical protein
MSPFKNGKPCRTRKYGHQEDLGTNSPKRLPQQWSGYPEIYLLSAQHLSDKTMQIIGGLMIMCLKILNKSEEI